MASSRKCGDHSHDFFGLLPAHNEAKGLGCHLQRVAEGAGRLAFEASDVLVGDLEPLLLHIVDLRRGNSRASQRQRVSRSRRCFVVKIAIFIPLLFCPAFMSSELWLKKKKIMCKILISSFCFNLDFAGLSVSVYLKMEPVARLHLCVDCQVFYFSPKQRRCVHPLQDGFHLCKVTCDDNKRVKTRKYTYLKTHNLSSKSEIIINVIMLCFKIWVVLFVFRIFSFWFEAPEKSCWVSCATATFPNWKTWTKKNKNRVNIQPTID